jgi:DNA-binding transcriptional LysR family regulator
MPRVTSGIFCVHLPTTRMALKNLLRRLDLTTLQLFLAVYEEGTLTRAAEREAIAVSAASKRLLELEQAVGATLFVRRARGMELTPAGETLLHHARRVLRDVENIGIELAEHATGVRGFVRMMANLSAIVEFLPEDLRAFFSMNERIKLDLEERPSSGVVQGIADSLADVGICSGEADTRGLDVSHYRHDSLVVVMPMRIMRSRFASRSRSSKRWIATTSACMRPARSTCARTWPHVRRVNHCGCASRCRVSMASAAWCRQGSASACCR